LYRALSTNYRIFYMGSFCSKISFKKINSFFQLSNEDSDLLPQLYVPVLEPILLMQSQVFVPPEKKVDWFISKTICLLFWRNWSNPVPNFHFSGKKTCRRKNSFLSKFQKIKIFMLKIKCSCWSITLITDPLLFGVSIGELWYTQKPNNYWMVFQNIIQLDWVSLQN